MTCPACDGFGYHPEGASEHWYERDWRLILDPTVRWVTCTVCGGLAEDPHAHLHQQLSALLVKRVDSATTVWESYGGWQRTTLNNGQIVWRWKDVHVVPFGPWNERHDCLLISSMGVSHNEPAELSRYLQELGAPLMPEGGWL